MLTKNQESKFDITQRGSSLVAMAITIMALGFLVTGGLFLMKNYDTIHDDQESVDQSRNIKEALDKFIVLNDRLPCPARMDAAPDTPAFGVEKCSAVGGASGVVQTPGRNSEEVLIGTIPIRTLNLSEKQMVDGYGKRYVYSVTKKHTNASNDVYNDFGAITIKDQNGKHVSETPGHVVYALVSPGEDDRGAYDLQGSLLKKCDKSSDAGKNCDGDAEFYSSAAKSFNNGDKTFTHSFTFHANTTPYRWFNDAWGTCTGACFAGEQTRTVRCRDGANNNVNDNKCNHADKPETARACALGPCTWRVGNWGGCS